MTVKTTNYGSITASAETLKSIMFMFMLGSADKYRTEGERKRCKKAHEEMFVELLMQGVSLDRCSL